MDIAVIADDFTGANANGALLTGKGFPSATCLDLNGWDPARFAGYAAVCLNVESRLLSREEAWDAVYGALRLFAAEKPVLLSKRVDSTLRGNIGCELEAALKALDDGGADRPLAVLVPSFPSSGRICVGGYLIVHGIPLECSPIAKDAGTPIRNTSVLKIIAEQSGIRCGFVPLEKVLAGPDAVRAAVHDLADQGCRVVVCDAVSDDDIKTVAKAVAISDRTILAVDPGPFTAELAALRIKAPRVEFENRVFLSVGSTSELTRMQLEALRLALPAHLVRVNIRELLKSDAANRAERERVKAELEKADNASTVMGACTAMNAEDVVPLEELAREYGMSRSAISVRINDALSGISRDALANPALGIGGLYTSGGEVTVSHIRALGADGFNVRDQVLPLAVYGHIIGGDHPGMPMLTKGGFVGDQNTLVECVEYLFTKISTKTRKG